VPDFDHLPKDLVATYNLIRDKNGNVMYVAEFHIQLPATGKIFTKVFSTKVQPPLFVRKSSFVFGQAV